MIASGEHPFLIDCEGLMQPRQRVDDMADEVLARYIAQKQLSHSVLRSGMLRPSSFAVRSPAGRSTTSARSAGFTTTMKR